MTSQKNKTIYWAILLNKSSKDLLLERCSPDKDNVYAEHMTIIFNPTPEQDKNLFDIIGMPIDLMVSGYKTDNKGQAVVVTGYNRLNGGIPHITISMAKNIKPFYSNELLDGGWNYIEPFILSGVMARYTKRGWDKGDK